MNPRTRHARVFARLALLAALLLAIVPTLGRVFTPAVTHDAMTMASMSPMPHGMDAATAQAMDQVAQTDGTSRGVGHGAGHPAPHAHDVDCAYCLLLATTLVAPLHSPVVAAPALPPPPPARRAAARMAHPFLGTLGSRGPPVNA